MTAPDYQQRVIDEKEKLDANIAKLGDFITSDIYSGLDRQDRDRLNSQKCFMDGYSSVLGQRIRRFGESPEG